MYQAVKLIRSNCNTDLSTEGAGVLSVLGHFHLLDGFTEGGTIPRSVLPDDSDLLRALSLNDKGKQ